MANGNKEIEHYMIWLGIYACTHTHTHARTLVCLYGCITKCACKHFFSLLCVICRWAWNKGITYKKKQVTQETKEKEEENTQSNATATTTTIRCTRKKVNEQMNWHNIYNEIWIKRYISKMSIIKIMRTATMTTTTAAATAAATVEAAAIATMATAMMTTVVWRA